ncbi:MULTISPECIES: MFS transporter [Actinomadura]|uniref:Na+/melibiose symporter n=1 Tax=Actinomadura madurae TaxID=1993 RepID=A0A1I5A2P1_9ACTN|nr:MFS transporter [Actinomadura madurae]MCP9948864.1 MFS transporter [Actinomadura madurae]MCP9965641.1 MFS transporter [Actinomadura madurae]MCP9978113.1 MFS transporter [Actinomadura madurae]MCQ0010370.1 MFS transporter [Actinomadura madurae]MCQ0014316.1 MFS transporter [Actinomadura madurae]
MSTTESARAGEAAARPRVGDLTGYAAGSLGMGVWVTVPGLLLLYFMTHTLGVSPALAGLTLLLPKILDAVVHPLFGTLSDRRARRAGHRRGMLRWGLLLPLAWIGLFAVPSGVSGWSAALWIGAFYIAGNMLYACFQVPYLTTPSDLRIGYHERTRVFMYRMLLLTVGLLGAGVAAPALVSEGGRDDYARMAVLLAGVLVATGLVALVYVRRLTERCGFRIPDGHAHSVLDDLRIAWRDREFRTLVLSYLFTSITAHLFLAAVPFYTEHVMDDEGLTAVFMGAFLVPAAIAGPVWAKVSRRTGKQRALLLCQLTFVVGPLALWPGQAMGVLPTVAVIAVLGTAFGGLQLFAFSLIPDVVAAAEERGTARAGAYTGVWTATDATGTAIGPYVYSAALAVGGFVSTTEGRSIAQSDSALLALLIGVTLIPAALMAVAIAFQSRFTLDRRALDARIPA